MEKDITEINSRRRVLAPHPHAFTAAMTICLYKCLIKGDFTMRTLNCHAQPVRTIPSPLSLHADRTLQRSSLSRTFRRTPFKGGMTQPLECQRVLKVLKLSRSSSVESPLLKLLKLGCQVQISGFQRFVTGKPFISCPL